MLALIFWIIVLIVSLFLLVKASSYFVDSSEKLGIYMGFSAFVIGVLITSIGTSLPELISSIFSILKNSSEIVVSNIVGSNIANLFLVFGIVAIVKKKINIDYDIISVDLPMFVAAAFLLGFIIIDLKVTIFETIISLLFLTVYLVYTIRSKTISEDKEIKKETKDFITKNKKSNLFQPIFIFVASIGVIFVGAEYVIESIIHLSRILNIGKDIIAVSIVALGTSLPELVVSLTAASKNKIEIAVGNILGSTIFNCVGVLGISSLFGNIIITPTILTYALPLMLSGVIIYFFVTQDKKITYVEGWILLIFYILFLGYIFGLV